MFNLIADVVEEIVEDEVCEEIIDFGIALAKTQTPLDPEAAQILAENLWDMLIED